MLSGDWGKRKMQQFMEDGNLFPGIHTYTYEDFHTQFTKGFPMSESRSEIHEKFVEWLKKLIDVLPPRYIWLDGSYLTNKVNPNDIDLVAFYYPEDITSQELATDIGNLINTVSRTLRCDAYFCYTFDHLPPELVSPQETSNQTYWMGQFGFDRGKKPKGIIQIDSSEILKLGGTA